MSLIAHVVEIVILTAAYGISIASEFGYLEDSFSASVTNCLSFSSLAFITAGFDEIVPLGPLQLPAEMEALTGFG